MVDEEVGAELAVGFAIETGNSFQELLRFSQMFDDKTVEIVRKAAEIERASGGMMKLSGATAEIRSFGNAASRELENARRAASQVEKAGEGMVRQLQRQTETFGKTASEIRKMRAETRALAAEQGGLTELAGRIRAASAELDRLEVSGGAVGRMASKSRGSLGQLAPQINDVATMAMSGSSAFQIFATQGGQILQIAQMAEGGLKGFAKEMGGVALRFAPLAAAVGVGSIAIGLFQRSMSQGIDTKAMVNGLGLTRAEIKRLKDTSVDTGDVVKATFQVMAESVGINLDGMGKAWGNLLDWMTTLGRNAMAGLYANTVGTFQAMVAALKALVGGEGVMGAIDAASAAYEASYETAKGKLSEIGADIRKRIADNKLADLQKQATEIKADRTPKSNSRAENLAREAAAVEAQIRNLHALADAYNKSGAAALIAEARVKAESEAIKKRADIEAMVDRQIRLAIAQRVADASKGTAALRDQAAAQAAANAQVRSGNLTAERAAEFVKDQLADLPLLAAIEVARLRGLTTETEKATAALAEQRAVREELRKAEETQRFNADMASGADKLAVLQEELRLVGATNAERVRALATLRATQEAEAKYQDPARRAEYIAQQVEIAEATERTADAQRGLNEALTFTADRWDLIASNVQNAAQGMADAFGGVGRAIGDLASIFASYHADRERLEAEHQQKMRERAGDEIAQAREQHLYALRTSTAQIGAYGDMVSAAKGFFNEKSKGYKAMMAAEKVFRAFEFAMSVKSMIQDVAETISAVTNSGARAVAAGAEGVANQSRLPFPLNLAAMAATAAALVAAGIAVLGGGGGKNSLPQSNTGTGTVLGDTDAKSESIKNAINALKDVDTVMLSYSRQMAASLRSIESQIGGFASVLVRNADNLNASDGVAQGFKANAIGSVLGSIPLIGGILKGLFGTSTTVIGSGLFGGAQSIGSILDGGFDADYYSDVKKKKKFFGLTTSTKYKTTFSDADAALENQFTMILRDFNDAILAAAGPLGAATSEIQQRLNGFVLNIGKIDLKGLTGEQIEEKLNAVFGAAADDMARAAFPAIEQFQQVGEGAFETLVRVASTLEAVTSSLDMLGSSAAAMSMEAKLGLADHFESLSALTGAMNEYFEAFYTKEEQAAARTAQIGKVFDSLGLTMPATLAGFRQLVEAQDLNTAAGQAAYATLLQLAPAFADLQAAMEGAKSAADIASERQELEHQLLELRGDTAALRALQLAKLDESNRALQQQIWAIQDAQAAAKAAEELRQAWTSVGDSIMGEVQRIRGLSDAGGGNTYAALLSQFNVATAAARGGDLDAGKSLPQLSQALLTAAENAATSRQELDRIRAQTAASLEATNGLIAGLSTGASTNASLLASGATTQAATAGGNESTANPLAVQLEEMRAELAQLRADNNAGHAANAAANGKTAAILDRVTAQSGGDAISTELAA